VEQAARTPFKDFYKLYSAEVSKAVVLAAVADRAAAEADVPAAAPSARVEYSAAKAISS
jgi:hypothetical protein